MNTGLPTSRNPRPVAGRSRALPRPASRRPPWCLFFAIIAWPGAPWAGAAGEDEALPGRVIHVIRDFEPDGAAGQSAYSSGSHADYKVVPGMREYSADTPFGKRCWRLTVDDPVAFSGWKKAGWDKIDKIYLVDLLKVPHLPPEADAVRLRCRVPRGSFRISVGGPVIQAGTSDVFAEPVELNDGNCAEWRTIDLSLNHRLIRNFRRARYSRDMPVIYHTRWSQEDFCLVGMKRSEGVILIDQIELVSLGEGRPFPSFAPGDVRTVATVADFEDDRDLGKVASIMHGYDRGQGQEDEFEQSWKRDPARPKVKREPVRYGIAAGGSTGSRSLTVSAHFEEEHSFALIRAQGEARANAIRLVLKARGRNPDLERGRGGAWGIAIDLLVLVAPQGTPLPWDALRASGELRRHPGPGYEYLISMERMRGVSYGFYHARRLVLNDTWTTLIIPHADFVCGYGQGSLAETFRRQLPLDGVQIAGLMITGPIRFDLDLVIDEISHVRVPGNAADLRSYWQVPDLSRVRLTKNPWYHGEGAQLLPVPE